LLFFVRSTKGAFTISSLEEQVVFTTVEDILVCVEVSTSTGEALKINF
jgi:hypothetical protein